ncbi:hypothetical protein Q7P37_010614 [Cladosporium fusiforme]
MSKRESLAGMEKRIRDQVERNEAYMSRLEAPKKSTEAHHSIEGFPTKKPITTNHTGHKVVKQPARRGVRVIMEIGGPAELWSIDSEDEKVSEQYSSGGRQQVQAEQQQQVEEHSPNNRHSIGLSSPIPYGTDHLGRRPEEHVARPSFRTVFRNGRKYEIDTVDVRDKEVSEPSTMLKQHEERNPQEADNSRIWSWLEHVEEL